MTSSHGTYGRRDREIAPGRRPAEPRPEPIVGEDSEAWPRWGLRIVGEDSEAGSPQFDRSRNQQHL